MKIAEWNDPLTSGAENSYAGVECDERNGHVRGMRGNTVRARAEDGVHAIVAVQRRTARARLPLVAWSRGIAEVQAAGALQQVAARRRHVA